MPSYVVRVWVPDRPGALGQVASRIGAVRGEIVGIEILERGADLAIDELVVQLDDDGVVGLLVDEIRQVDGVEVEEVRPLEGGEYDPATVTLEAAAGLVAAADAERLALLAAECRRVLQARWAAVVDGSGAGVVTHDGSPPDAPWLQAFVAGAAGGSPDDVGGADDVLWARVTPTSLLVAVGRDGVVFRHRERRQLAALAAIAGRCHDRSAARHP